MPKLILASASPRRKDLLSQVGIIPDSIMASEIDESQLKDELPLTYVQRMAREKACVVAKDHGGSYVLAADTVVVCGRRILPKAESNSDVTSYLKQLSGRQHQVLTALCVISPSDTISSKVVTTRLKFKRLSAQDIIGYIESQEGIGKAGGYAIQGLAGSFVKQLNGSYTAVVGLPLYEAVSMLTGVGYGQ